MWKQREVGCLLNCVKAVSHFHKKSIEVQQNHWLPPYIESMMDNLGTIDYASRMNEAEEKYPWVIEKCFRTIPCWAENLITVPILENGDLYMIKMSESWSFGIPSSIQFNRDNKIKVPITFDHMRYELDLNTWTIIQTPTMYEKFNMKNNIFNNNKWIWGKVQAIAWRLSTLVGSYFWFIDWKKDGNAPITAFDIAEFKSESTKQLISYNKENMTSIEFNEWLTETQTSLNSQLKTAVNIGSMNQITTLTLSLWAIKDERINNWDENISAYERTKSQVDSWSIEKWDLIFINKENTIQMNGIWRVAEKYLEQDFVWGALGYTHVWVITNTSPLEFSHSSLDAESWTDSDGDESGYWTYNLEEYMNKYEFTMAISQPDWNKEEVADKAIDMVNQFRNNWVGGYNKKSAFSESAIGTNIWWKETKNCWQFVSSCLQAWWISIETSLPNKILTEWQNIPSYGCVV
jgi:hypothetical protein